MEKKTLRFAKLLYLVYFKQEHLYIGLQERRLTQALITTNNKTKDNNLSYTTIEVGTLNKANFYKRKEKEGGM